MNLRLAASNIRKSYNGEAVLKDCSFTFDKSDIYVLTGRNGSGKSTFLRICALLETPDSGSIAFFSGDGPEKNDIGLRRRITLVLPKVGVFNTTVLGNVAYGLKLRGMERKEREQRADRALEFVGLLRIKHRNALTLSSGETQRMGIARALAVEPEILFLDEPTASVDSENTKIIERIIMDMRQKNNSIIVVTTHDREQAERLADRLLVMKNGRIEAL
ncbi:MAG TPA: ABC transporter ATP-binding protein [Dissulfurispiraceae bacterium]